MRSSDESTPEGSTTDFRDDLDEELDEEEREEAERKHRAAIIGQTIAIGIVIADATRVTAST